MFVRLEWRNLVLRLEMLGWVVGYFQYETSQVWLSGCSVVS